MKSGKKYLIKHCIQNIITSNTMMAHPNYYCNLLFTPTSIIILFKRPIFLIDISKTTII